MPARPVFLWSDFGSLGFLGLRLKKAGVPVILYIHKEHARDQMTGYLPKTTDPMPPRDALVIFDNVGHGELGMTLRKRGQLVIGGNPFDKELEVNRWKGIQLMHEVGIATPSTKQFSNTGAAEAFLEKADGEWFVKVSGTTSSESDTCNAPRDLLIRYLRYLGTLPGEKSFILQQKVDGVEVSTNGWFDGVKFIPPYELTFEEKKFLTGDLGPRTGCENCVVWMSEGALPRETLEKIEARLAAEHYVGPVDLNAIIDKDGVPHGIEWTARLGFDAAQAWVRFLDPKTIVEQLSDFAAGILTRWEYLGGYSTTMRITVPPYPEGTPKETKKMQGFPLDPVWLSGDPYDPEDVMRAEGGPVLAGASSLVGVIGAIGPSFKPLRDEILEIADSLKLQSKQYRIDPLERAERDWARLFKLKKLAHAEG